MFLTKKIVFFLNFLVIKKSHSFFTKRCGNFAARFNLVGVVHFLSQRKMSESKRKMKYFLVRCDKPVTSFTVISERAVIFDPDNLELKEGEEITFEFPEDVEEQKKKRGRKPQKKVYTGTVVEISSMLILMT